MPDLLALENVVAGYGQAQVVSGVSLRLPEGGTLALLGRNGMGKTTLLRTIIGAARLQGGAIRLAGRSIGRWPSERRAAAGIGWVPQERAIFPSLSVEENLTAVIRPGPWTIGRIYEHFPRLGERRRNMGSQISGGEQQMLAIGRALALNPRLILLDEPFEGLAPVIVDQLATVLARLVHEEGLAFIIVEQHAPKVLGLTDRALVLERGQVVHEGPSADLQKTPERLQAYLGVGGELAAPPSAR
jgi:branched-chain amino acid transport system ATP-binding protein